MCQTCKQEFTGAMRTGLATAWRSRVAGLAAESPERLTAESNLAQSLLQQGKFVEAERMLRKLHEVRMRVHGAEDPDTLATANDLAACLSGQGQVAEAEQVLNEEREANELRRQFAQYRALCERGAAGLGTGLGTEASVPVVGRSLSSLALARVASSLFSGKDGPSSSTRERS
jgi:hypothetical protein